MVFKRFRINILARVAALCATLYVFFYLLTTTQFYATIIIVGAVCCLEIYSLIHYVEKTNRDLNRFLLAIKHSDFTQSFTAAGLGSSFDALNQAFSEVISEFHRTRADKEEHYRYLQTVVQHVGIGLLAFSGNGEIELINNAANQLLRIPHLTNIRALQSFSAELVETLFKLKSGEKALVRVQSENESLQLAVYATEFKLRDQGFTLVSLQNIQSELEEKELEAWQKLIRVLTHEIMNSVTPISSLAATVNDMLSAATRECTDKSPGTISRETLADIDGALETIQKRSSGLMNFVNAYRNLTLIPPPKFEIFQVQSLLTRVEKLMQNQAGKKRITLVTHADPESLEVTADPELIEQVLINLTLNAIQALNSVSSGKIELLGSMDDRGRVLIQVRDNGRGIDADLIDRIFIPFFTTRKGGSGIGLSLTRQIMRLHRGSVTAASSPGKETVFTLRF